MFAKNLAKTWQKNKKICVIIHIMQRAYTISCALFLHGKKGGENMAKGKSSIKSELAKIVRKRVEPSYLDTLGIVAKGAKSPSVLQAIALAQVKKGLEGDLKAAEFIEELLCDDEDAGAQAPFDVVVKVVGETHGA